MTVGTDQRALDELCVNTIRTLSMDAVQQANSGHPGTPMALAPIAYLLYTRVMRHAPERSRTGPAATASCSRAGHASMLLYSTLHLAGYDVTLDQIKRFRQLDSPARRPPRVRPRAGRRDDHRPARARASRPRSAWRSASACSPRASTAASTPDRQLHVLHRLRRRHRGGHLVRGVLARRPPRPRQADRLLRRQPHLDRGRHGARVLRGRRRALRGLRLARPEPATRTSRSTASRRRSPTAQEVTDRPSLIIVRTHIAPGSPNKQDTHGAHGSPLGEEEIRLTKEVYGYPSLEPFFVPDEALEHFRGLRRPRRASCRREWQERSRRTAASPARGGRAGALRSRALPEGFGADVPQQGPGRGHDRHPQGLAGGDPVGGRRRCPSWSAAPPTSRPSTLTLIDGGGSVEAGEYGGRNLHFGIREHAHGRDRQRPRADAASAPSAPAS